MAGKGLPPVPQLSRPRAPKSKEPERDFAPPVHPVVYFVVDKLDPKNRVTVGTRLAYDAWKLSTIKSTIVKGDDPNEPLRKWPGIGMCFSECEVTSPEDPGPTLQQVDAIEAFARALCPKKPDSKLNGQSKLNGKGSA